MSRFVGSDHDREGPIMDAGHGYDDVRLKADADTVADPSHPAGKEAAACPSCGYASGGAFETCPRCGLIIQKYHRHRDLVVPETLPASRLCPKCGDEPGADAFFCPRCGEPAPGGTKDSGGLRSAIFSMTACLAVIVAASLLFRHSNESLISSPAEMVRKNDAVQDERPLARPAVAAAAAPFRASAAEPEENKRLPPPDTAPAAPSSASAAEEPAAPAIPYANSNTVGITRAKVIFASGTEDYYIIPVTSLRRVSMKDRRIVAHVKVLIPPDQSYQLAGKLYDAAGTLVMNVSNQGRPTSGIWHWWYYHDFDRAFEKEGAWKFVFFVNGQKIVEDQVEVTGS